MLSENVFLTSPLNGRTLSNQSRQMSVCSFKKLQEQLWHVSYYLKGRVTQTKLHHMLDFCLLLTWNITKKCLHLVVSHRKCKYIQRMLMMVAMTTWWCSYLSFNWQKSQWHLVDKKQWMTSITVIIIVPTSKNNSKTISTATNSIQ